MRGLSGTNKTLERCSYWEILRRLVFRTAHQSARAYGRVGLLLISCGWLCTAAQGADVDPLDWPNWRGPEQNGISRELNLPESWSPKGENLLWRKPEFATRSTPVVLRGKLYTICRHLPESTAEAEKVVCLNAETGELIWENVYNIYLSDAPAERVGWSSVVADPETGHVYAQSVAGTFIAMDGETGKTLWSHSMLEEYGMVSTYGGRTSHPVVFEDLVITSCVNTGWGETAVPAHRFFAFDKQTGKAVWTMSTKPRPEDTTYSQPFFTVFNGQAAMVVSAADGEIYALQPRTGKVIWQYNASPRGINTPPMVEDGIVYCGHSEQNTSDRTILGATFAFDGRTTGVIPEEKLLWKNPKQAVGRSGPLKLKDRIYFTEDGAKLLICDAATGKEIIEKRLGSIMMGSLVYGDGKIYAGEANGRWTVMQPTPEGVKVLHQLRLNGEEILGSPVISHGRIYIPSNVALYCIGKAGARPTADARPALEAEAPITDQQVAHIQVVPNEILTLPGTVNPLKVRGFNKMGQIVPVDIGKVKWTVEGPGKVLPDGAFHAKEDAGHAVAMVTAQFGELKSVARARLVPPLPWKFDFNNKLVPPTWIGASYRHQPKEVQGEQALVKISTIPKGTRSQAWMGMAESKDYTIQADFLATEKDGQLPDMGLINKRYTLDLMGEQKLQIRSWTARLELRFAKTLAGVSWQAGKWYTLKFRADTTKDGVNLKGKFWPRGSEEPKDWMIEATDPHPNRVGSPGLFGKSSTAEFYLDNVSVTPNG